MVLSPLKSTLLVLLLAAPAANAAFRESIVEDNEAIKNNNEASSAFSTTSLRSNQRALSTEKDLQSDRDAEDDMERRQLPAVSGYTVGDEVDVKKATKHYGDDDDGGKKGASGGGKKGYGDDDDGGKGKGAGGKKGGDDDDDDGGYHPPHPHPTHPPKPEPLPSCRLHPDDKPCMAGCGHGKILNPYKSKAQALRDNDYQPAPCKEYNCVCADSGCQMSWHDGCIAEYMRCQETQICGNINTQPTSVSSYNFGACPNYAVATAPTPECFAKPATHAPTHPPVPHGDDDDDDGKGKGGKGGKGKGAAGKKGHDGDDDDGKGGKGGKGSSGDDDDGGAAKGGKGKAGGGKKG